MSGKGVSAVIKAVVTWKRALAVGMTAVAVACGMSLILYIHLTTKQPEVEELSPPDVTAPFPPSDSILGQYRKAAVVSNGYPCAVIGKEMLEKGGTAVDAAIATLLCDGVCNLHNMGVGGGFLMTVYRRDKREVETLNAREGAPAAATKDMFKNNRTLSTIGGLSIAVPGELRGYQAAWQRFGKLPWEDLFEPTITLCKEGVPVNEHLARTMVFKEEDIRSSETLRKLLLHADGSLPKLGDKIKMPVLAKTLQAVAHSPKMAYELYEGSLTEPLVEDIKKAGGIITVEDLRDYRIQWKHPIEARLPNNLTLYTTPPPGSGLLLAFILRVLDGFVTTAPSDLETIQRITEAFKHAYARRTDIADPDFVDMSGVITKLTSPEYIKEVRSKIRDDWTSQDPTYYGAHFDQLDDHGTANIVVLAPNGDAVAVTSTINLLFGSQFVSPSTGIILNNEMDDFSSPSLNNYFGVPPSPANYIEPKKRPLSSMCPSLVIHDNGDVMLAVGSAGGTRITTSTALVTMWNLWFGENIKEAIDHPRFHHQLIPMKFAYEYGVVKDIVSGMKKIGHEAMRMPVHSRSCVTAIARSGEMITSNADDRRPGRSVGF